MADSVAVQAWETEEGTSIVWRTHDAVIAEKEYSRYLMETAGFRAGDADFEEAHIPADEWEAAARYWAAPELVDEVWADIAWPAEMFGSEEVEGRVPFMAVTR